MKILCVIDSLGSGGAQSQLVNLAIGFKEKGNEVSFLTYHSPDFYGKFLEEANIPVKTILELNYFKRLIKMRKIIRSSKQDVVLSFLEGPNFICEIASFPWRDWKLIVGERSANPKIMKSLKLKMYRWFHFLADYVVSNSFENIRMVKKINPFLADNKCKVIYNIVNFERWKPISNFKYRENGKFSLIIVSNHQKLKNAKGLIDALNLLPLDYKNQIIVHWYGRKDSCELKEAYYEAENLVKKYKLENIIKFFDANLFIHEIVPKYDCLGLFSLYEGMPNSICEGMAIGKPIISTDVSDIKLIIENGVNGFIIDDCKPNTIKDALVNLLKISNNELMKVGDNASVTANNLFNKNTNIIEYLNLMSKK